MTAEFHLRTTANEMSVRALLSGLRTRLRRHGLSEAACGTVEIVLAEALNNIVEHAYGGGGAGKIGVHARLGRAELVCTLSDRGAALPARHLPGGDLAVPELRPETLPEGGFGWLLIRKLTRDIHYARTGGSNRLTVWFDLPDPDSGAGA